MRTVVLISGNGTNLQALIDADIDISLVLSNRSDAYGLNRGLDAGIESYAIAQHQRPSEEYDRYLAHCIGDADLIVLAGFMRILSPWFVKQYEHKIVNIHPSLLPLYKGLNTHQRAIEAKENSHGCTVHWVTEQLDTGPLIAQRSLLVDDEDTPETLRIRVQALEHELYPEVIKNLVEKFRTTHVL